MMSILPVQVNVVNEKETKVFYFRKENQAIASIFT